MYILAFSEFMQNAVYIYIYTLDCRKVVVYTYTNIQISNEMQNSKYCLNWYCLQVMLAKIYVFSLSKLLKE